MLFCSIQIILGAWACYAHFKIAAPPTSPIEHPTKPNSMAVVGRDAIRVAMPKSVKFGLKLTLKDRSFCACDVFHIASAKT